MVWWTEPHVLWPRACTTQWHLSQLGRLAYNSACRWQGCLAVTFHSGRSLGGVSSQPLIHATIMCVHTYIHKYIHTHSQPRESLFQPHSLTAELGITGRWWCCGFLFMLVDSKPRSPLEAGLGRGKARGLTARPGVESQTAPVAEARLIRRAWYSCMQ